MTLTDTKLNSSAMYVFNAKTCTIKMRGRFCEKECENKRTKKGKGRCVTDDIIVIAVLHR